MTASAAESGPLGGSGLETALAALPPVYAAGARLRALPLSGGRISVPEEVREPLLLVRLREPLADQAVVVRCAAPDGGRLPPVVFAPFSAQGTLLPVLPPAAGDAFTLDVRLVPAPHCHQEVPAESVRGPALPPDRAAQLVEGALLEGVLARLACLATLEKQRVIRQAREIAACRHADLAFFGALDSLGRDLGVYRLPDEDDARYRSRLKIFTSWRLPTPARLKSVLNGPGPEEAGNAGLPGGFGIGGRFRLVEQQNPLMLATLLVAVGPHGAAVRSRLHELLRTVYLLDLDRPVPAPTPPEQRRRLEEARQVLTDEVTRPAGPPDVRHLAPSLAVCLARLVRLIRALSDTGPITLLRAHVEESDPLHELGLGATLRQFGQQRLTAMAAAVDQLARGTSELSALARTLAPRPSAEDPAGRWLAEPCGLRTVHPLTADTFFVSTLPMGGLTIGGPDALAPGQRAVFQARHSADSSTGGLHELAAEAARRTEQRFVQQGLGRPPTPVTGDGLDTALRSVLGSPAVTPPQSLAPLVQGDLLSPDGAAFVQQVLDIVVLDQVVAYPFTLSELAALGSGDALRGAVAARAQALLESGFYSVYGVFDGGGQRVLMLAAVSLLPGRPPKQGEAPPVEFQWLTTEVPRPPTDPAAGGLPLSLLNSAGGRIETRAEREGLALLVCLGHARRGLADPYQVRVEMPGDSRLDREQYSYVMNILEALCPLGIELDTTELRRRHVDFDADEEAGPFPVQDASRTYRRYRRRRALGGASGRNPTAEGGR
ncbi:hypothetical protein AB0F30_27535 [Streptomyces sp. NPDC029006]|uniref:hypothetical protein n=1 Tax=Streptomyces sp. NPDC029006 TaxID=3155467 RepID=UPI0033CC66B0